MKISFNVCLSFVMCSMLNAAPGLNAEAMDKKACSIQYFKSVNDDELEKISSYLISYLISSSLPMVNRDLNKSIKAIHQKIQQNNQDKITRIMQDPNYVGIAQSLADNWNLREQRNMYDHYVQERSVFYIGPTPCIFPFTLFEKWIIGLKQQIDTNKSNEICRYRCHMEGKQPEMSYEKHSIVNGLMFDDHEMTWDVKEITSKEYSQLFAVITQAEHDTPERMAWSYYPYPKTKYDIDRSDQSDPSTDLRYFISASTDLDVHEYEGSALENHKGNYNIILPLSKISVDDMIYYITTGKTVNGNNVNKCFAESLVNEIIESLHWQCRQFKTPYPSIDGSFSITMYHSRNQALPAFLEVLSKKRRASVPIKKLIADGSFRDDRHTVPSGPNY